MSYSNQRSWVIIDLTAFEHNFLALKKIIGSSKLIMQIVKADAYGHGSVEISKKSLRLGASCLGVANTDEAILLRHHDIKCPIVVLSPCFNYEIDSILSYDLIPVINNISFADELNQKAKKKDKKISIHLEIDTGMGRSGISLSRGKEFLDKVLHLKNLRIDGIFSHFAASESDPEYTNYQFLNFKKFVAEANLTDVNYLHMSNSSGIIEFPENFTNLVRTGLITYGIYPNETLKKKISLTPVMNFKTKIILIKKAEPGETIGYNRTYKATKKMLYGIIPVGYADGFDYFLSNKGIVLCDNKMCPIIGKISMDMTAIDLSSLKNAEIGKEVLMLGGKHEELRAENITKLYSGLSYELVSQIGRRAQRFYQSQGKIVSSSPVLRRDFLSTDFDDKKLNKIIESSITERMQSKEISTLLYKEILKKFFFDNDNDIHYRKNFVHHVTFEEQSNLTDYFLTHASLSFNKILLNESFYIVCVSNINDLEKYIIRKDVEYRWLLDKNIPLNKESFSITSVKVNNIELHQKLVSFEDRLEILCFHPNLRKITGTEVKFSIVTKTFYPKKAHQFAIYIVEMTKGLDISFAYPKALEHVDTIPVFSGNTKYPLIQKKDRKISVFDKNDQWFFPNSAIIFAY